MQPDEIEAQEGPEYGGERDDSLLKSIDDVPFSILAKLYQDLRSSKVVGKRSRFSKTKQVDGKRAHLTQTWLKIAELCGRGSDVLAKRTTDDDFIPAHIFPPNEGFKLISLLVPMLDSAHTYLGMKETKLADTFVKALDLIPNGADAQWLKHHKEKEYRPERWKQDPNIVDGNLASVLKAVLTDRCPSESSLTIGTVWSTLTVLSQVNSGHLRRISRQPTNAGGANSTSVHTSLAGRSLQRGQDDFRSSALRSLIQVSSPQEVAEVARIILKDVDIRLTQDSLFSWFHPGAKQHYTQVHDLHQLLKDCYDPKYEIGEASVHIGQYASVMLTMRPSRRNLDTVCEKLRGAGETELRGEQTCISTNPADGVKREGHPYFIMEPKLDGERLQLHKWKGTVGDDISEENHIKTFSRRGNDSSPMYAEALRDVILSGVKADGIILDGEIMIWDELKAAWLRFEDIREVATAIAKKSVPDGSSYSLKYMVFDVLYVHQGARKTENTRQSADMVIRLPLYKRRLLLEKLIRKSEAQYGIGAKAVIEVVEMERGYDERQLTQALQRYETLGYEGVIAKNPGMPYVLAERNLELCIKLKPDYFDGGIQDLDVVILGAKYSASAGHRKQRAGKLSSFLVGVRTSDADAPKWKGRGLEWENKMKQCKWTPVASVGTGYSDVELAELQKAMSGEWKDFDAKDLPEHFEEREYAPTLLSDVAKWIDPWKSVVLSIRAFEMNKRYGALRFPRVERINWDKPYYDVPTFAHLLDLDENKKPAFIRPDENDADDVFGTEGKKKAKSSMQTEEDEAVKRAKEEGHVVTGGKNARAVMGSAMGADVSEVLRICSALKGLSFYVMCPDKEPKETIEVMIYELGGTFVQNFSPSVDFIVCTSPNLAKVKQMKERFRNIPGDAGKSPIIQSGWIEECHARKSRVAPILEYVVFATRQLEQDLYRTADRFGDSWQDDTDVKSIIRSLSEVEKWKRRMDSVVNEIADQQIEQEIARGMKSAGDVFQGLTIFVPQTEVSVSGSVGLLRAMGASCVEEEDSRATHILVHSSVQESRRKSMEGLNGSIVTEKWVRKCVDNGSVLHAD